MVVLVLVKNTVTEVVVREVVQMVKANLLFCSLSLELSWSITGFFCLLLSTSAMVGSSSTIILGFLILLPSLAPLPEQTDAVADPERQEKNTVEVEAMT